MTAALVAGLAAGYGIAIPVGAVAVLIIDTASRRGLRWGAAAGLGAASADLTYAALAVMFGGAVAHLLAPWSVALRWASVGLLLAIAGRGLRSAIVRRGSAVASDAPAAARSVVATYGAFLGITLLNPMTVAYFAALVLGLPAISGGGAERVAFALGAFVASASWQLLLAGFGALLHRRTSVGMRELTSLVGNVVILAFAAAIARDLVAG